LGSAALLTAVMAAGGGRFAAAQTNPIMVIWQAPPACPDAAHVQAEVDKNLARSGAPLVPVVAMVNASGPTDGRWQASLVFQAGYIRAERRFEAESCEAVASAAALVIALWVEGGPDTPPPPTVAAPSVAARDPEKPPDTPAAKPRRRPFVVMLDGVLDWRTMPDPPAGGMEAAGGPIWTFPRWRLRALAGLSFFPSRRTALNGDIEQADLELFDVSGRACATVILKQLELGPCAGGELAIMHGWGTDFQDSTHVWVSLLGSALASWSISPAVGVFGRAEAVVPTARKRFSVPDGNVVYQVPDVAVRGALGLELRFP
jgi:hypothetical protein